MSGQICFIIAPIGTADSEIRKRSDQVLKYVIEPAASECGYSTLRADKIADPGLITSQIIQHIVDDPLVIADLTDRNPNVFYELAIRHAIRKPLVQIIRKGEQIPFDLAGMRTIELDHKDLDSVAEAKREIISQIRALQADPSKLQTPISASVDLQALRQSGNPEQRSLGDVLEAVGALRSSLAMLGIRIEHAIDLAAKANARHESTFAEYSDRFESLNSLPIAPGVANSYGTLLTAADPPLSNLQALMGLGQKQRKDDGQKE